MSCVQAQKVPSRKDYLVDALWGPGPQDTSVIVPHYFSGFGHILNGAKTGTKGCNCLIGNFLCANGIVSLIKANRDIAINEELQWDYNGGRLKEYDMSFGKNTIKTKKWSGKLIFLFSFVYLLNLNWFLCYNFMAINFTFPNNRENFEAVSNPDSFKRALAAEQDSFTLWKNKFGVSLRSRGRYMYVRCKSCRASLRYKWVAEEEHYRLVHFNNEHHHNYEANLRDEI